MPSPALGVAFDSWGHHLLFCGGKVRDVGRCNVDSA